MQLVKLALLTLLILEYWNIETFGILDTSPSQAKYLIGPTTHHGGKGIPKRRKKSSSCTPISPTFLAKGQSNRMYPNSCSSSLSHLLRDTGRMVWGRNIFCHLCRTGGWHNRSFIRSPAPTKSITGACMRFSG